MFSYLANVSGSNLEEHLQEISAAACRLPCGYSFATQLPFTHSVLNIGFNSSFSSAASFPTEAAAASAGATASSSEAMVVGVPLCG